MISTIKTMAGLGVLLLTMSFYSPCHATTQLTQATKPNTLTEQEKKEGWKLLFDGMTFNGWRGAYLETMPARGWELRDGMLIVQESGGNEAAFGGDIITVGEYSSFELTLDFKLTKSANSGIKYFVTEQQPKTPGSAIGLEYQLLGPVAQIVQIVALLQFHTAFLAGDLPWRRSLIRAAMRFTGITSWASPF